MAAWSGVFAELEALGGNVVAWPLTPPVVEVPALEPTWDCAPVALWSGGVVLELEVDGTVDGEVLAAELVWPGCAVALLCELMLD